MAVVDLKDKTRKLYKSRGSMWCRAVKDNVVFNNQGWIHLSFSRNGHRRSDGDLKLRHHLFKYVHQCIDVGILIKQDERKIKSKSGVERNAKYYELVYWCEKEQKHISVVLRKIESSNMHYYSVRRTSNKIKKALAKAGLV